jgi:hypothetical protein
VSRHVVEQELFIRPDEDSDAVMDRVRAASAWAWGRVRELAATAPPHLVEQEVTVTDHGRDAAGTHRVTVTAVMNTEKGWRLPPGAAS